MLKLYPIVNKEKSSRAIRERGTGNELAPENSGQGDVRC